MHRIWVLLVGLLVAVASGQPFGGGGRGLGKGQGLGRQSTGLKGPGRGIGRQRGPDLFKTRFNKVNQKFKNYKFRGLGRGRDYFADTLRRVIRIYNRLAKQDNTGKAQETLEQLLEIQQDYKDQKNSKYYSSNGIDSVAAVYSIAVTGYPGQPGTGAKEIAVEAVATAISQPGDEELAAAYITVVVIHFGCDIAAIVQQQAFHDIYAEASASVGVECDFATTKPKPTIPTDPTDPNNRKDCVGGSGKKGNCPKPKGPRGPPFLPPNRGRGRGRFL